MILQKFVEIVPNLSFIILIKFIPSYLTGFGKEMPINLMGVASDLFFLVVHLPFPRGGY